MKHLKPNPQGAIRRQGTAFVTTEAPPPKKSARTMEAYAKALASLPRSYKSKPMDEVSVMNFEGAIIMCHPDELAIIYRFSEWCVLKVNVTASTN